MSDFKAKITAELDTTKVEQQIKNLNDKKIKLDVDADNAHKGMNKINEDVNRVAKNTSSFGTLLKKSLDIGTAATITAKMFQLVNSAIRDATKATKEFDDAITNLRMATGDSYETTQKLVRGYNQLGKSIGSTTSEISNAADSWLRQGHSISDTNTLIRDSMILAKVSQIDSAEATKYLTASMKGYKVAAHDVIGIVDKLTAVDLASATDAAGLAEAMSRTAAVADMAGISMDRLIAYVATVGEVTQRSMSTVGESWKTILSRMSAIKSDKLELVDEDGTTELLSDVEITLKNVGIDLRKTVNEYENYGDVLDNLAKKWANLNQDQQNALSQAFAGTRRANDFRVLMENYDNVHKYINVAANSAGTAEKKFEAYLDSIEAKTKTLQAAFEALAVNNFSTQLYGGIIEATTGLITFLDKTNMLKGSLTGLVSVGAIKTFTTLATGIQNATIRLNSFNSALHMVKTGNIGEKEIEKLSNVTSNLSKSQLKAVLSSKALSNEQRIAILTAHGMSEAEAQAALTSMGLATAEGTATKATFSLSGAFKGLWATLMANPLILVFAAITAVVSAVSSYNHAVEESRQKAIDASQTAQSLTSEISDLILEYDKLSKAVETDKSVTDQFVSTQDALIDKLGLTKSKIEELVDEYGFLSNAIKNASIYKLQELERDIRGGSNAYKEELLNSADPSGIAQKSMLHMTSAVFGTKKNRAERGSAYDALNALEKAGYISSGSYSQGSDKTGKYSNGFEFFLDGDLSTVEGIVAAHKQLGEMLDIVTDAGGSDNFVYDELYTYYNKVSESLANYENSVDSLNENLAEQYYLQTSISSDAPKTQAEFEKYRRNIIDSAVASGEFIGSQEDIEAAIDGVLNSQPLFAEFYANYSNALKNADTSTKGTLESINRAVEDEAKKYTSIQNEISATKNILSAQTTGKSISFEDFNSEELKDYRSALEYVNGTLQLNADKVNELVKAKTDEQIKTNDANKSLAQSKYLKNAAEIEKLRKELTGYTDDESESSKEIKNKIKALQDENSSIREVCSGYDLMSTSLLEATGAYQNWLNAQNGSDYGDMFDSAMAAHKTIKDTYGDGTEISGDYGSLTFKAAIDLIVPDTVDKDDLAAISSYMDSVSRYLYEGDNGMELDIGQFASDAYEKGLMELDETGENYVVAARKTMEDFANELNLSMPLLQAFFDEMQLKGFEFDWADEASKTIGDLAVSADVAAEKLRELNPDLVIELDISEAENKADALDEKIEQMQNLKIGANAEEIEYANTIISYCVAQKQQLEDPAVLNIDTSKLSDDAAEAVLMIQEFKTAYNELELQKSLGLDTTQAQEEVNALSEKLASSSNDYVVKLKLDTSSADGLNKSIIGLGRQEVLTTFKIDETALLGYKPENKEATLTYNVDSSAVDAYDPENLTRYVDYYVRTFGSVGGGYPTRGFSNVNGTAMANGSWGAKTGGETLVGEINKEIVV